MKTGVAAGEQVQWRNPSYLALISAQFVSLLGSQLSVVALPWFVLATTGSPGKMTTVLLAQTLPLALFGIPAGALVDRFNKKRLMVALDLSRALLTVLIPTLAVVGRLEFPVIVVISFLAGTLITPYMSARMAIIPTLVGEEQTALTRANTALQLSMQITAILGPASAGLLIAWIGNIHVLFIDAATFFFSGLLIAAGVRYHPDPTEERGQRNWWGEIRSGLGFVRRNQLIRTIILIGMFTNLGYMVLFSAVLPVFVRDTLSGTAGALGLLLSAEGAGAVIGMLIYANLAPRWRWSTGYTIRIFIIGMALPLWLLPLAPGFWTALLALTGSALFTAPIMVVIQTTLQTATPTDLRGRVFAAFNALFLMMTPAGLVLAGPLLERYGAMPVIWMVCLLISSCAAAAWLSDAVEEA